MKSNRKPNGYWTRVRCEEVSKLCSGRTDLYWKYRRAYDVSLKNNWLDEFYPKNPVTVTEEKPVSQKPLTIQDPVPVVTGIPDVVSQNPEPKQSLFSAIANFIRNIF